MALLSLDIGQGDEVITQSLTFIATANSIKYTGAEPIFLDIDKNLSLDLKTLSNFLEKNTKIKKNKCINIKTNKIIKAIMVVNNLGFTTNLSKLKKICKQYNLYMIEDAAESFGSFFKSTHTGLIGDIGIFSFNGNKIITTGAGGAIVTLNSELAKKIKHLSATAKLKHPWTYIHDQVGYNYRIPNVNAALGYSQISRFKSILKKKIKLQKIYKNILIKYDYKIYESEFKNNINNYWINAFLVKGTNERNDLLNFFYENNIYSRTIWNPLHKMQMFKSNFNSEMNNTNYFYNNIVCLPSGIGYESN